MVFQADSKHEEITDVYMGLVVCRVESCLYAPKQILDFIKDIEVDLQVACDALKAGGDPSKRHAFCLFVNNFSGAMSIPKKVLNWIILTPTTVPQGHACIVAYATPPYSSAAMIPKSIPTMSGATSSFPMGHSTMIGCSQLSWSCRTTTAH